MTPARRDQIGGVRQDWGGRYPPNPVPTPPILSSPRTAVLNFEHTYTTRMIFACIRSASHLDSRAYSKEHFEGASTVRFELIGSA